MSWVSVFIGLIAGCTVGGLYCAIIVRRARGESESWRGKHDAALLERARLATEAERVPALAGQIETLRAEVAQARTEQAQNQARLEEQARAHGREVEALKDVRVGIDEKLTALTAEALRNSQGSFLELANAVFEKHKAGADAELADRQAAVAQLIFPLTDALQNLRQETQELERSRSAAYGALSTELKAVADTQNAVRTETTKLVQALRASPKTRGRWGEHTLHNVLELSGLSPYCDFSTEETFDGPEGRLRPDVVIRMPGDRYLVIDAKTPIAAYLDALEAATDTERLQHLVRHAAQTRDHVRKLAAKAYWDGLTVTPDYVVMFIPGENFFAAALEHDQTLIDDAARQRVVIVTPSTLIALARAVAYGWRQEKVAENAQRVHELGRELYRRMTAMAEHIQACGTGLSKAVKGFNDFIGSLEHSVMPQVRRFNELEVEGTATAIPEIARVDIETRLLRTDRDFAGQLTSSANSDTERQERPAA